MSCTHGNGPPERCSQCLNAPARKVSQQAADLVVDGEVVRAIEVPSDGSFYPRRRRK